MNRWKTIIDISKILFIIFLPLFILLSIFQHYSYNKNFYMQEFDKYNVENVTGMNNEDLSNVAEKLISYLKGEENNLNIEASINGDNKEVFGEREKKHMIDVKNLFTRGQILRSISFGICLIAILVIILTSKRKKRDIYQAILLAGIAPIALTIILLILVKIDFHKYFTYFHKIFFNNELWLLNPKTDVLIQMLPLEFFIDIATRIIGWFLGISIIMTVISFVNLKRNNLS